MMANEELADDIFPYIVDQFSDAVMIKLGIEQWITVSKRGQNALIKRLKTRKDNHLKCIREIDSAIERLRRKEESP
jgi:hypothetical protein